MANEGILKNPTTAEVSGASAAEIGANYGGMLENPDAVLQQRGGGDYKVYAEALRDDQVKSCFQQRRLAVVGSEWTVEPGLKGNRAAKKAADALRDNLTRIDFDRITDQMLYGVYYGHAVGEIIWQPNGSLLDIAAIKVRDRARFRYDIDGGLHLARAGFGAGQLAQLQHFGGGSNAVVVSGFHGAQCRQAWARLPDAHTTPAGHPPPKPCARMRRTGVLCP